uniref:Uncharacterized protein n=1 Tax=Timema shepardi TaxID=629360 RepID=A0A7R9FZS6_TIMSH|nr:unnamed protein product [Timema shepardi]
MEAVVALENQLQRFEETLNSFPLGACSANEASSVSAKIQEMKKTALLYQCAILFMKADQQTVELNTTSSLSNYATEAGGSGIEN